MIELIGLRKAWDRAELSQSGEMLVTSELFTAIVVLTSSHEDALYYCVLIDSSKEKVASTPGKVGAKAGFETAPVLCSFRLSELRILPPYLKVAVKQRNFLGNEEELKFL
jgi:hypothetical protein